MKNFIIVLVLIILLMNNCTACIENASDKSLSITESVEIKNDLILETQSTDTKIDETKENTTMKESGFKINEGNKKLLSLLLEKKNKNENIVFSNAGIMSALSIADKAADGNTKKQIEMLIGDFNKNLNSEAVNTFNYLAINELQKKASVKEEFKKTVQDDENIKGDIYIIDENNSAENIADAINARIKKETNGQIENSVSKNIYESKDFVSEIGNVIHFKGKWAINNQESYDTTDSIFVNELGEEIVSKFVSPFTNDATLIENDTLMGVELPYQEDNKNYKFVALISKDENAKLMDLDLENLNHPTDNEYIIDTKFPTFEIEDEIKLKKELSNMGLNDMFDATKSDFTKGFDCIIENVYASDVIQNVKIKVDEYGTEASAHTKIPMFTRMAMPQMEMKKVRYVNINFNRPFIFMIYDTKNEMPLFIGTIKNVDKVESKYSVEKEDTIIDEIKEVLTSTKTKADVE